MPFFSTIWFLLLLVFLNQPAAWAEPLRNAAERPAVSESAAPLHSYGNRVQKTVGSTTTFYLVDSLNPTGYAQVLEELTSVSGGQTNVTRTYVYGHDLISQDQWNGSAWVGHFYGYDGGASVRYLTDESGTVSDTYDYDAFGNLLSTTGNTPNLYQYRGEQFDPDLGLYYLRARYMNPGTGRFWSQDTYEGMAEDPSSLHKYLYAGANPVSNWDPSGYLSLSEFQAAYTVRNMFFAGAFSAGYHVLHQKATGGKVTRWSILQNFTGGMLIGPAILPLTQVRTIQYGLGIGGVLMAASYLPTVLDPYEGAEQRSAAAILAIIDFSATYSFTKGLRTKSQAGPASNTSTNPNTKDVNRTTNQVKPEPGTLTQDEIDEIQRIADKFDTTIDVVGSRAANKGRNIETDLPVTKDPSHRSDIDFRIDKNHPDVDSLISQLKKVGKGAGNASRRHSTSDRPTQKPFIRFIPKKNEK